MSSALNSCCEDSIEDHVNLVPFSRFKCLTELQVFIYITYIHVATEF
jgi:hypothetical protein